MSSGSKEKEPRYAIFFSQRPSKRTTFRFPNRAPMEIPARLLGLFYTFLQFLIKISQIKNFFPSLNCRRKRSFLHVPQKRGPYGNRSPFPEPCLAYPSGSPVKERSLQVAPIELPRREIPCSQSPPSFIFQSPRYMSPLPDSPKYSMN